MDLRGCWLRYRASQVKVGFVWFESSLYCTPPKNREVLVCLQTGSPFLKSSVGTPQRSPFPRPVPRLAGGSQNPWAFPSLRSDTDLTARRHPPCTHYKEGSVVSERSCDFRDNFDHCSGWLSAYIPKRKRLTYDANEIKGVLYLYITSHGVYIGR